MNYKICTTCKNKLPATLEFFNKHKTGKNGLFSQCKKCRYNYMKKYYQENRKEKIKYSKQYRQKNLEKIKESAKKYHQKNQEERNNYMKKYRQENPEIIKKYYQKTQNKQMEYSRQWRQENPEEKRKYMKKYRQENLYNNIDYKISHTYYTKVNQFFKGINKSKSTMKLLGCTLEQFKEYLEKKFKPGMTFDNYGSIWHIDHKIPISAFNRSKKTEQKKCFHYTNLQPLFAKENLSKNNKWKEKTLFGEFEYRGNILIKTINGEQ